MRISPDTGYNLEFSCFLTTVFDLQVDMVLPQKKPPENSGGFFVLVFLLFSVASATGNVFSTGHVTFGAVCLIEFVTDIDRMDEVLRFAAGRDVLLYLVKDIVAKLAVLGDDPAFSCLVLAVMAAETSRRIEMADVVRIGIPLDFHCREEVSLVNILHALHGLLDGGGLILCNFRVIFGVIGRNISGDGGKALFLGLVRPVQEFQLLPS